MSTRQRIGAVAAPAVLVSMIPVFRFLEATLGSRRAWIAGIFVYWAVWCVTLPMLILGWRGAKRLFERGRMTWLAWLVVTMPPLVSLIGRFFGIRQSIYTLAISIPLALLNGVMEELLWRGVFTGLFPDSVFWGVLWPSFWFGLWHFAPASVNRTPYEAVQLVAAAMFLGLAMGWVAHSSSSIRWTAFSHALAGALRM